MKPPSDSIIAGSHLKKLARHGSLYLLSNVLVMGGSALLLPIYTHELDPTQYAIFKNLISAGLVAAIFITLHLDYAYSRFYFEYDEQEGRLRRLYSTLLWFGVAWGGMMSVIAYFVMRGWAANTLGAKLWPHLIIACAIPFVSKLNVLAASHYRSSHRSGIVTMASIIGFLSGATLSVTLLLAFGMGVAALLWGALIGPFISAAWYYSHLARDGMIGFDFSSQQLGESLRYSVGVLPMAASAWLAGQADAIFVAALGSMNESGIYSVAFDIGRIINLLVMSLFMAYTPMVYRMLKEGEARSIVRIEQFQAFFIHVLLGLALFLSVFSPELFEIFIRNREYHAGVGMVPIIAFAFVFGGLRKLHVTLLYYHKATFLVSIGGILQAVVSVGLNILLIPKYGGIAAAWSKLISLGLAAVYVWLVARRYQPLRFDRSGLFVTAGVFCFCLASIGLCHYVLELSFWPMMAAKFTVLLIAVYLTWRSRFGDQMRTVLVRPKEQELTEEAATVAAEDNEAIADPKEA